MNLTLIQGWTCSTTRQCFQIQFRQSHWHEERPIFLEGMQVQQEYYWYPSLPKKAFSEMKGCRVLKTPPTSNHTVQKMHSKWAKSTVPLNKLSPSQRVQNNKTSIRSKRITQIFLDRYYIYIYIMIIRIFIYISYINKRQFHALCLYRSWTWHVADTLTQSSNGPLLGAMAAQAVATQIRVGDRLRTQGKPEISEISFRNLEMQVLK